MASSSCTYCGLGSQRCQCGLEASTIANGDEAERAIKLTRTSFCVIYLVTALLFIVFSLMVFCPIVFYPYSPDCNLEVFVDSFSISNASTATADWNVGFLPRTLGNGCNTSLHTIESRLYRGDKVISESITPDNFGLLITGKIEEPLSYSVFKTVATQEGMIWDLRVKVVFSVNINDGRLEPQYGFLLVNCGDIPVNFTADAAGNMKGSLVGYMRPCDYLFRQEYSDITY